MNFEKTGGFTGREGNLINQRARINIISNIKKFDYDLEEKEKRT